MSGVKPDFSLPTKDAEISSAAKNMVSRVRHDILQPTAAMKMLLSRLNADTPAEKTTQILSAVTAAVDEIEIVIQAIIGHQMLQHDLMTPSIQSTNLTGLLVAAIDPYLSRAEEYGLTLDLDCEIGDVQTDPELVHVILDAAIDNALDYTFSGAVTVHAQAREGGAEITITDSGIGISPDDLKAASTPYFISNPEKSRRPVHLGLGLSTAHEAARILGADIELSSDGNGTQFKIKI